MERSKVWAVVAALAMAGTAAIAFAGNASAAEWHTYKGDVFAGHAYGIDVPERANNVEFVFDGAEGGSAALGVYAQDGEKVGYYQLAPGMLSAASVANPDAGQLVVYVYDITDGALTIRVNSDAEPAKLELAAIELVREETTIGTFEQGRLDQVITAKLDAPTVFVTLLYEGSAKDLDATVSSPKGPVVTILDETATAFSPGVWTSLKGERSFNAANLDGLAYEVEVHAAQVEGTMTLTTLGIPLEATMTGPGFLPTPITGPGESPSHPAHSGHSHAAKSTFTSSSAQFGLEEGVPVAFTANAGTLELADPAALDEDGDGDASYDDDCSPLHAAIAIYDPADGLLAFVELSHETPTATVELPVSGEYVAYARYVEGDVVLAKLSGSMVAPALRTLEIEEELLDLAAADGELELVNTPLALALRYEGGLGALSNVQLSNENGLVASADSVVVAPGLDFLQWGYEAPENFAKGAHDIKTSGIYDGGLQLVSTFYVRASDAGAVVAPEPVEEPEDPEEPREPSTPLPLPPFPGIVSGIIG